MDRNPFINLQRAQSIKKKKLKITKHKNAHKMWVGSAH